MTSNLLHGTFSPMRVGVTMAVGCLFAACQFDTGVETSAADVYRLAENGETASLLSALKATGEVDPRDVCYRTPLTFAVQFRRTETVRRLLDAGVSVHLHEKGSYMALMLAAGNGHTGVVALLAAAGAGVNHVEITHGWTALIWAAKCGHHQTVALLVELGGDATIRDDRGWTVRDWALHEGHPATAELL